MGLFKDAWNKIFSKTVVKRESGYSPFISSSNPFGTDITISTLVTASINAIADEASKMSLKSIRKVKSDKDGNERITQNDDDLNRLFDRKPNPLMTMKDLLYWSVYRLETKSNFYWFPERVTEKYYDGRTVKRTNAIYPVDSLYETIEYSKAENRYIITFHMESGEDFRIPYDEVIHVKKNFGTQSYYFGSKNRTDLLETLGVLKDIKTLLPKAVNASMQIKGILTAKSMADVEGLKKFRDSFETTLNSSEKALGVLDVAGDFKPVQIDPKIIDKDIFSYFESHILNEFGVDLSIIQGNADETKWAAFYQKCIEPIQEALEQAATAVLFTPTEFSHGNRIKIYDKKVQHLSMKTRLELIKELGPRGYLSRAEQRELAGYEPDGGSEQISLNYVDKDNQNNYQKSKKEDEEDGTTKK